MTLTKHEQLARRMADGYLTSVDHDEHLAKQRRERARGVRK